MTESIDNLCFGVGSDIPDHYTHRTSVGEVKDVGSAVVGDTAAELCNSKQASKPNRVQVQVVSFHLHCMRMSRPNTKGM
jgi:hypothetical protein